MLTGLALDKARANGDGPGDHARAQAAFLTGRQPRKTQRGRHPGRHVRRPVDRRPRRRPDPVPVAGDRHRARPPGRQLRLRLQLCLPVELLLARRHDAERQGGGPEAGLRPPVRPAPTQGTRRERGPSATATTRASSTSSPRTPSRSTGRLGRDRSAEDGRVPDGRPRDRAADRSGPARSRTAKPTLKPDMPAPTGIPEDWPSTSG